LASCYVEALPGARASVEALALAWFDEPSRILVNSAMPAPPLGGSPDERLKARFSRWVPLGAVTVVVAFQCALWLARRSDVGLYGLLGLRSSRLAAMVAADFVFAVAAPVAAGALLAAVCLAPRLTGMVLVVTAWDCARAATLLALVPLVIFGLLAMVKPFDAVRGR
jgi:hypothetical protein